MSEKQKLILVNYINVGNKDENEVYSYVKKTIENIKLQDEEGLLQYFVPIRGESRVECINPVRIDDDLYEDVIKKMKVVESAVEEFTKNKKDE